MICYLGASVVFSQFAVIFMGTFHYLSWDIMEPICYLMTFANFTFGYGFYMLTQRELALTNFNEILTYRITERKCKSQGIDTEELKLKEEEIKQIRKQLRIFIN